MIPNRSIRLALAALFATACAASTLTPLVRGLSWVLPVAVVLMLLP
mgnify:CR=1 FL=1